MKKFIVEAIGTDGIGGSFIINPLDNDRYQIFNEQQERLATIEIDDHDAEYCRQSLDCSIDLSLIKAIRAEILYNDQLAVK